MLISKALAKGMNEQVGNEFGASMQYYEISAYFDDQNLPLLAKLFWAQADEEKVHAEKFIRYLMDTGAELRIPAIAAPKPDFSSAEEAVQAALDWEKEVTQQINNLYHTAVEDKDYLSQQFLDWFIDEQLEEINKMDELLGLVRRAGEGNLLMVENFLIQFGVEEEAANE
jgi:ferritin